MDYSCINKLYPDIIDKMMIRYYILDIIKNNQPIGRRSISSVLSINERFVRNETELLGKQGLITIETMGMYITKTGLDALLGIKDFIFGIKNVSSLSSQIKSILNIPNVFISDGSIGDELGRRNLGELACSKFLDSITHDTIIGITGGSTVGLLVDHIGIVNSLCDLSIVPARGSMGGTLRNQSNILAAKLAEKISAKYYPLYLPDNFDLSNISDISKIPDIKQSLDLIENIDVLIFGIGNADKMAVRRGMTQEEKTFLKKNGAVAEAFGNYFDKKGNIILESKSIGLSMAQYKRIPTVIAIAGDDNKEEAIIAISSIRQDLNLVITEECAKKIINNKSLKA